MRYLLAAISLLIGLTSYAQETREEVGALMEFKNNGKINTRGVDPVYYPVYTASTSAAVINLRKEMIALYVDELDRRWHKANLDFISHELREKQSFGQNGVVYKGDGHYASLPPWTKLSADSKSYAGYPRDLLNTIQGVLDGRLLPEDVEFDFVSKFYTGTNEQKKILEEHKHSISELLHSNQ